MISDRLIDPYLNGMYDESKTTKEKIALLSELWEKLCQEGHSTFFIDIPSHIDALAFYSHAKMLCMEQHEGRDVSNGEVWKMLMPTLQHTTTATGEDLPDYFHRESLVITDDHTHLLFVPEMVTMKELHSELASLPNFYKDKAPLTPQEQAQIRKKDPNLWQKHYPGEKAWMTQSTFEKLVFIINMAHSPSSEIDIDSNFQKRFADGLQSDPEFKRFIDENYVKIGAFKLEGKSTYDDKETQLTACYEYFFYYLKTLPQNEQEAFELISFNNMGLYALLDGIHQQHTCMTGTANRIATIAIALTSEENLKLWKHTLSETSRSSKSRGQLAALVQPSTQGLTHSASLFSETKESKEPDLKDQKSIKPQTLKASGLPSPEKKKRMFTTNRQSSNPAASSSEDKNNVFTVIYGMRCTEVASLSHSDSLYVTLEDKNHRKSTVVVSNEEYKSFCADITLMHQQCLTELHTYEMHLLNDLSEWRTSSAAKKKVLTVLEDELKNDNPLCPEKMATNIVNFMTLLNNKDKVKALHKNRDGDAIHFMKRLLAIPYLFNLFKFAKSESEKFMSKTQKLTAPKRKIQ